MKQTLLDPGSGKSFWIKWCWNWDLKDEYMLLDKAWRTNVSGRIISQCKASEMREFEVCSQVKDNTIGFGIAKREHVVLCEAGDGDGSQVVDGMICLEKELVFLFVFLVT